MERSLNEFLGKNTGSKGKKTSNRFNDDNSIDRKRKSSEQSSENPCYSPTLVSSQSASCQDTKKRNRKKEDVNEMNKMLMESVNGQDIMLHESELTKFLNFKSAAEDFKKYSKASNELTKHHTPGTDFDILEVIGQLNQQKIILIHNLNLIGDD